MMSPEQHYRERWLNRIQQSRRRYFYERLKGLDKVRDTNFFQISEWIKKDIIHFYVMLRNIFRQIRANGSVIQQGYGISKIRQFQCMSYLAFKIKVYPANFIKYQLFKKKNWKRVNDFAYAHTRAQRQLLEQRCPQEGELFLNKFTFFKFCKGREIKTPNVLAVYEDGECTYSFYDGHHLPEEDLFIKKRNGMMGEGAKKLVYRNGNYIDKEGTRYVKTDVFDYLETYSKKNEPVLLQKVIENHPSWMKYTSGSLATCRIITYKCINSSKIDPLFCSLRMPHGNSDTDNFSGGGLAAAINLKNGIMGKAITAKPVNETLEFSYHPDTQEQIEGSKLPRWEELVEFVKKLHRNVESVFVGWDVCLAEEGPCVMEGSLVWGADIIESSNMMPLYDTAYPLLYEQTIKNLRGKKVSRIPV